MVNLCFCDDGTVGPAGVAIFEVSTAAVGLIVAAFGTAVMWNDGSGAVGVIDMIIQYTCIDKK